MRLILIAPGPTAGTGRSVFGDTGDLLADAALLPIRTTRAVFSGPEPACRQTVGERSDAAVLDDLAGPRFGAWADLDLEQVLAQDPAGLQQWVADPHARPHGGESLAEHLARVGTLLDDVAWPEQGAGLVVTPFTVRAGCVHALGAGPSVLGHLDVPPGSVATLSRHAGRWRLQGLVPPRRE